MWSAAITIIVQFAVFKYLYPFASFINGDSYLYLETAYHNSSINVYPVGYSNFLRLFSVFTKSDTALIGFQYLILQASILFFLFTMFFFYRPGKTVEIFSLCFLILNPVFLYLANYVSSDTLFVTLSLIWFTLLLWIVYRPSLKIIAWHALILFLAFTVRYNALFYPVIAGLAFLISKQRLWIKLAGPSLCIILIGLFIIHTGNKYKKLTGIWQFSPFTGWQMANNAMYAYRHVDSIDRKSVPLRFQGIDKIVTTYFDTTRNFNKYPSEKILASTVYMWTPRMPLQKYMRQQYKNNKDTTVSQLKRWATMGPLYEDYGWFLIKQYPFNFLKFYIWPNTIKYYAPPVEFLEYYSTGKDSVNKTAQEWFEYRSRKISNRTGTFRVEILDFLPIIAGSLNVVFIFGLAGYLILQGYRHRRIDRKAIILITTFWLVNLIFSIFASPIALRFQLFPITVFIPFSFIFIEYITVTAMQAEINQQTKEKEVAWSGVET